jgi:hypothetical protein
MMPSTSFKPTTSEARYTMTTEDLDAWAMHLRFKYGLSAPIAPVAEHEEETENDIEEADGDTSD